MTDQRTGMFIPALIGGGAAGILTGLPLSGCLCCLWIIGGAMLSANILSKNTTTTLSSGDGAILGIFTGIIAAVFDFFVSIPFERMNMELARKIFERIAAYGEDIPSGWEQWLDQAPQTSIAMSLLGLLVTALIFSALGALGGIMGISLFGKKSSPSKQQGIIDVSQDKIPPEDPDHR